MAEFKGSFESLCELVSSYGCKGIWGDITHGKQLRCEDGSVMNWYAGTGKIQFQGPQSAKEKLQTLVENGLQGGPSTIVTSSILPGGYLANPSSPKKVFVVHGHDTTAREQLELVLHRLNLDPFVLANTGGGGLTIIEALEKEIGAKPGAARFGIVLMTPDDMGYAKRDGPDKAEPRARQNVVLEMGMLIAALG